MRNCAIANEKVRMKKTKIEGEKWEEQEENRQKAEGYSPVHTDSWSEPSWTIRKRKIGDRQKESEKQKENDWRRQRAGRERNCEATKRKWDKKTHF